MIRTIEKIIIKTFSSKFYNNLTDILLHIALKLKGYKNFGTFNETGEEYLLNMLIKNKVKYCLDIGAHNGDYSKKLLETYNMRVIAFEPMKQSFKNLKNLKNYYSDKFQCFNIALSDKNGFQKIYFAKRNSQLALKIYKKKNINFLKKKKFKNQKIKVSTLDYFEKKNKNIFPRKIDFLKIDTEGNDLKVLKGGLNFIKKYKPEFIQIEMNYHYLFDGENLYQFKKILNNYEVYKILPFNNGLLKVDENRPENNIFHLSNFVFIKK